MGIVVIVVIILVVLYRIGKSDTTKNIDTYTTNKENIEIDHQEISNNKYEEITDIDDSLLHILHAKNYYYEILDYVKELRKEVIYDQSPLISKQDKKKVNDAYLKLERTKSKFVKIYGTGKAKLQNCMKNGIYKEVCSPDGKVDYMDYNKDGIIKYLSDVDIEFKSAVIRRCNKINNLDMDLHPQYWDELMSDFLHCNFSIYDSGFAEAFVFHINLVIDSVNEIYDKIYS